jgi:hypothetical protein
MLQLADGEAASAIGRPDDGRVHQLQYDKPPSIRSIDVFVFFLHETMLGLSC